MKFVTFKYTLIYLLCLFCYMPAQAQFNMLFTSDHELPNSLVNKIIVDNDGMVWIATEDGLCKFDGSDFTTYWNEPENPNSIQSNFVRTLCCDKQGHILIGTLEGAQLYRPETDDFTPVITNEDCGVYHGGNISGFLPLANGDILVCGNMTFSIHFDEKDTPEAFANEFTNKVFGSYNALQDGYGNIWLVQQQTNTYRLNRKGELSTLQDRKGNALPVSTIKLGPDGKIYAGAAVNGLLRYNSITEQFDTLTSKNEQFFVRDICVIPNTKMLAIGTDGNGIKFYNCENDQFFDNLFDHPFIDASSLKAHTLAISPEGTVWVGVYQKGVIMVTPSMTQFRYIGPRSSRFDLIGNQCVTAMMVDHDKNVWVGTDNGGISVISDSKSIAKFLPSDKQNSIPASVITLFEDSKKRIWVGSYHQGCGWIDFKTGNYKPVQFEDNNGQTSNIYQFVEDKHGVIWIASMGMGILRYDEQAHTVKSVNYGNPSSWICDLVYNSTSEKLFAGTYNGLCIYDLSKDSLPVEQVLPQYVIHDVNEYAPNQLSLCTNHGLILYDYNTKQHKLYTKNEGLPSNNVLASETDNYGNLWISSSAGLTKFNCERSTYNNFTVQDGLQGNEFYKKSSMRHPDGTLWFGGINGISWFSPTDISLQAQHFQVRVVGLYSDQTHILPTQEGIYNLSDEEHAFTMVMATLPLNYTKRVVYSYSMDNSNWQALPPLTNRISFTSVPSGNHTFRFKATCDGLESEVGFIKLYIAHPWYHSWWAICLLLLVTSSLAYLLMLHLMRKRQMRERLRQHKQTEAINEAKLQFFMNIAHEFRTPMTLIVSPLQKLISNDKDDVRQHSYQLIERNANRILNLINQLMDLRKIDKEQMHLNCQLTNFGVAVADLTNTVSDLAEARNIKLQMHDECPADTQIWLDSDCFEKILMNLLSNSLKYTPSEGQIVVNTSKHTATSNLFPEGYVEVTVTDTGIGIPEVEKAHVFDRFYQVRQNNKHIVGTGIGLNLVHSLVKLHHGNIQVCDNPEGQGTRFSVCLPMGSRCFKRDEIVNDVPTSIKNSKNHTPNVVIDSVFKPQHEENIPSHSNKRNILLVDDDSEIRNYLHEELATQYRVTDCSDGQEAIEKLSHDNYDLVITDLMMPGVDGTQLCKKIRGNILLNHLPIIMLTAKNSDEDRISSLQIDVDAFIAKPFNIEVVKSTVQNLLRSHDRLKNTYNGNQAPDMAHDTSEMKTPDERLMERIKKAIAENLDKPNLTTDDIASAVGVSRVHLYRKLKELTNQSARSYIRNIRLMKAAEMLSTKRMPIADVSYACGFGNANNFSTAFRDLYGMSPTEYMEAKLEEQQAIMKRKVLETGINE